MSRRRQLSGRMLRAAAAVAVTAAVAGGCGGGDDDRSDNSAASPTAVSDESPVDTVEVMDGAPDAREGEILIGLRLDDAEALAADEGWEVRVAVLDGEQLVLTMDFVMNRVNVEVTDGIVTGIVNFG